MRWRYESFEDRQKRLEQWHVWFAWYPITIDKEYVWLERVWRLGTMSGYDDFTNKKWTFWRYQNLEDRDEPKTEKTSKD